MTWTFAPEFDAAARAALDAGKPLIYCAPPAGWAVRPLLERLGNAEAAGPGTLVLVPDRLLALDVIAAAAGLPAAEPARIATGTGHAARLLEAGQLRTLVATPSTALRLLSRSLLKPEAIGRVLIGWPELQLAAGAAAELEALLGEVRAPRVVATGSEASAADFIERYAHRAPAVMAGAAPDEPGAGVRYAVAAPASVTSLAEAALDRLQPSAGLVWDPYGRFGPDWGGSGLAGPVTVARDIPQQSADVAIATDLPSAAALAALHATGAEVVILVRPAQLPYLRVLASPANPIALTQEVDRARDWQDELRETVRRHLSAHGNAEGLLALAPLFEEFDPALVAAALLQLGEGLPKAGPTTPDVPLWAHLHLNVGRRDGARAGDIVGVMLNAVGLPKDHVGRVDIRDTFTLVEVRAESAESAKRGLSGATLKGRPLQVRFDRK